MLTVLIDYESGNLHSAHKAFERMARETDAGEILVSHRAEDQTVVQFTGNHRMPAASGKDGTVVGSEPWDSMASPIAVYCQVTAWNSGT